MNDVSSINNSLSFLAPIEVKISWIVTLSGS